MFTLPNKIEASNPSRIKDIVTFEGIRDNLLVGYGLVVGLNGTGDNLSNSNFTKQGLTDFLGRMGVNMKGASFKTKNIAAVTVTTNLRPFSRQGTRLDVNVSTLGDAKSLEGGTLLATSLVGADGEVYAVSQGSVSIGGFQAIAKSGSTISKGVVTNGFIANGAIVEKEISFKLDSLTSLNISLNNPDISTAVNIASIINDRLGEELAKATDPATINLKISNYSGDNIVQLLAKIENIEVRPDTIAKIIIDEASGTIVIGENVRISPVAIAQGNLTIKIDESDQVSQPNPFAPNAAQTLVVTQSSINIDDQRGSKIKILPSGTNLKSLVEGLNSLGVSPRDLITILQNIRASGALQADIETR
jgi:flagellar P-ring protein precursor FlgI